MKVVLPTKQDSWNSYPSDELEFQISDDVVTINIRGEDDRRISIAREDFVKLLNFLNS